LESYINYGFENNLALKQKEANYKKSVAQLNVAKGLFYPNITLNARYSLAEGGRIIEFPVGDLLNPVYENLNNLYKLNGFPVGDPVVLENEKFPFYRPTEQETKIRLIQPVFNSDIYFNRKINKELSDAKFVDIDSYKRELKGEIKLAYINYIKSLAYLNLLFETKVLINENIRVNQSLYKNTKITIDKVYRSQAELSILQKEIANANKLKQNAQSYFNFLLNKSFDSGIDTTVILHIPDELPGLNQLQTKALENRQELLLMDYYNSANEFDINRQKMNKSP
jgi:outer membrane protein TolC